MGTEEEKNTSPFDELDLARVDELRSLSKELDVVVEAMGIESIAAQTIMGEMDAVWITMPEELREMVDESGWLLEGTKWDGRTM